MGERRSRREYGAVFDSVAEAYDAVRPGYPPALVDQAIERGDLVPGSRVVEVGSGTGKLTELLVARGLRVDAVEPGPNMIAAARKRLGDTGDVTFHNGPFEDVDLPEGAFKAFFSATAFHWVDPQVGWSKAASLLEDDGVLALLVYTTLHDDVSAELDEEFVAVVRKHAPEFESDRRMPLALDVILAGAEERRSNASEVWDWLMSDGRHGLGVPEAAGFFDDVHVDADIRVEEESADELIAHLRTTSLYFRVDPGRREAFEEDERRVVERHGGLIRRSFATLLMTARKRS